MTKTITIKYRDDKTSKTGKPFLSIKDTEGNQYSVWEQIIFHLFTVGATLTVDTVAQGKFNNITGVAGQLQAQASKASAIPNMNERIWESLKLMNAKIDKIGKMVSQLAPADEDDVAANNPPVEEINPDDIPF